MFRLLSLQDSGKVLLLAGQEQTLFSGTVRAISSFKNHQQHKTTPLVTLVWTLWSLIQGFKIWHWKTATWSRSVFTSRHAASILPSFANGLANQLFARLPATLSLTKTHTWLIRRMGKLETKSGKSRKPFKAAELALKRWKSRSRCNILPPQWNKINKNWLPIQCAFYPPWNTLFLFFYFHYFFSFHVAVKNRY